jgi:hypothetical protein
MFMLHVTDDIFPLPLVSHRDKTLHNTIFIYIVSFKYGNPKLKWIAALQFYLK